MAQRLSIVLVAMVSTATGQQVFVGDTGLAQSVGNRLTAMTTSMDSRDFPAVMTAYTSQPSPTLQSLGQTPAYTEADGSSLRRLFRAYWGRDGYPNAFITAAIDNNVSFWGIDLVQRQTTDGDGDESRDELAMKGVAYMNVILGVFDGLEAAWSTCVGGNATGSQYFVNQAWGYYAAPKGPILLGEKRCSQFDTCDDESITVNGMAVRSAVNIKLNRQFLAARQHAASGDCGSLGAVRDTIKSQIYVPVLQAMMRYAYRTDPNGGAATRLDEVAEGWAFTAAVLPLIAECSTNAASTIRTNMDTLSAAPSARFPADGFRAVVQAAEGTYPCLGIACSDVKALVDSTTGEPLWRACTTAGQGSGSDSDNDQVEGWQAATIALVVMVAVMVLVVIALVVRQSRQEPSTKLLTANPAYDLNSNDAHVVAEEDQIAHKA